MRSGLRPCSAPTGPLTGPKLPQTHCPKIHCPISSLSQVASAQLNARRLGLFCSPELRSRNFVTHREQWLRDGQTRGHTRTRPSASHSGMATRISCCGPTCARPNVPVSVTCSSVATTNGVIGVCTAEEVLVWNDHLVPSKANCNGCITYFAPSKCGCGTRSAHQSVVQEVVTLGTSGPP